MVIKDCFVYSSAGVIIQNSTADCRTYIENCVILASKYDRDNEMIGIYSGAVQMLNCQVESKGYNSCLKIRGSARILNIALCTFTNSSALSTISPLVYIDTSSYSTIKTFTNCGFIFESATSRTPANGNNTAIYVTGMASLLYLLNNIFSLQGTPAGYNAVDAPSGNMIVIHGGNQSAPGVASNIAGTTGSTKIPLNQMS